ncbi:MAG: FecR domain-containing protein [Chloroflexota bacterium]
MIEAGRHGRERLAWIILFGGLFACLFFTVSVPIGVNAFIQNATRSLTAQVQANQGTVGIDAITGQRRAVLTGEPAQSVEEETTILTDTTASALVTVTPPDSDEMLTTMQIASNTTVQLNEATAPRFSWSGQPYQMALDLQSGRVRLDVPAIQSRPVEIALTTPQSEVSIREPGRYTVDVTNDATQVTVQESGVASIFANDGELLLTGTAR